MRKISKMLLLNMRAVKQDLDRASSLLMKEKKKKWSELFKQQQVVSVCQEG